MKKTGIAPVRSSLCGGVPLLAPTTLAARNTVMRREARRLHHLRTRLNNIGQLQDRCAA